MEDMERRGKRGKRRMKGRVRVTETWRGEVTGCAALFGEGRGGAGRGRRKGKRRRKREGKGEGVHG